MSIKWGLFVFSLLGVAMGARAESLADAIAAAYQTNPTIRAQKEQVNVLQDRYLQAEAGYAPNLTLTGSADRTTTRSDYSSGGFFPGVKTNNASLSFVQALYSGGRIRANVSAARLIVLAGAEHARSSEAQVVKEVIESYVAVRRDQEILAIATSHVDILQKQLENTRARSDLREVTVTDLATAQSRLAAAKAQMLSAKGQLDISRNRYRGVVGTYPGTLDPEPELEGLPSSFDNAQIILQDTNPDLLESQYTELASRARIAEARASSKPKISLRVDKTYGPATTLQADLNQEQLSVSVQVSKSLFSGGFNRASVEEALDSNARDRDSIAISERQTSQALGEAWAKMVSGGATRLAYEQQASAAQAAFDGVQEEEKVGLRSPLEVLNLEQELVNARVSAVIAKHDEYSARASVLLAMGTLDIYHLTSVAPVKDKGRYRRFYEISPTELAPRLFELLSNINLH